MEAIAKAGRFGVLMGLVILGAAAAAGVFDPTAGCLNCSLHHAETLSLPENSHSQTRAVALTANQISVQIKTLSAGQTDYLVRISWGDATIEINPAGYVGVDPGRPLAPFPHVDRIENELFFKTGVTGSTEIWLNREFVWERKSQVGEFLTVEIQTYENPVELDLKVFSN